MKQLRCKLSHSYVIAGSPETGVFGYCNRCGLRTPLYPWYNGAWAKDLLARAKKEKALYIDKSFVSIP